MGSPRLNLPSHARHRHPRLVIATQGWVPFDPSVPTHGPDGPAGSSGPVGDVGEGVLPDYLGPLGVSAAVGSLSLNAPGTVYGWVDGGGDFLPKGSDRALVGGSYSAFERVRVCDETPDASPITARLPSLRLTPPDEEPGSGPDEPDSDTETCYNPDDECKLSRLPGLSPSDPLTVLRQRREDLKAKLVDTQYPRPRNPERTRPEAHYVLSPSRLRPRPLPSPRPRTPVPPSGIRSTKRAHTPTASQIRRDTARNAARGYR